MKKDASIAGVEWEDAALRHCRALLTLAGLLIESGQEQEMRTDLVNDAGALIEREARQLKKLVENRPGQKAAQ